MDNGYTLYLWAVHVLVNTWQWLPHLLLMLLTALMFLKAKLTMLWKLPLFWCQSVLILSMFWKTSVCATGVLPVANLYLLVWQSVHDVNPTRFLTTKAQAKVWVSQMVFVEHRIVPTSATRVCNVTPTRWLATKAQAKVWARYMGVAARVS